MTKTFPVQPVCIIFTDIVDSTEKWDASQAIMWEAVQTHQVVIRTESHRFGGFECKTLGDGFLISFSSPRPALHFCLAVQNQLAKTAWHKSIIQAQAAKDRAAGLARRPSRGLVLRIGLHWGLPHQIILDPVVQRKDFYGNIVNVASRIEGEACGDEIAVSDAFLAELHLELCRWGSGSHIGEGIFACKFRDTVERGAGTQGACCTRTRHAHRSTALILSIISRKRETCAGV